MDLNSKLFDKFNFKAVCVSPCNNAIGKGMNPSLPLSAQSK